MGYGDNRGGRDEDRWQGNRQEREGGGFGNRGSGRGDMDRGRERSQDSWGGIGGGSDRSRGDDDNDRGFMERAGQQVRSWFSDDDDQGGRSNRDRDIHWERSQEGRFQGDPVHFRGGETRWNQDRGQDRSRGQNMSSGGSGFSGAGGGGVGAAETWGGSGFGGSDDNGRRFDRIDAGSTGTQGAHPMSAPVGGGYGSSAGIGAGGGFGGGSSARSAAIMRQAGQQGGQDRQDHHDPHYSEWRQRQISELDRDYDEYRREHQSKFDSEFGGWRQKRQGQRQHMGRVTEHMEVLGSDGEHIGTVDKVRGDKIILTKNDERAGGVHHSIPCSWIETVDEKVHVNKSAAEAFKAWTDEDSNRALFERPDQGSDGPHMLNRSFSGTYDDKK